MEVNLSYLRSASRSNSMGQAFWLKGTRRLPCDIRYRFSHRNIKGNADKPRIIMLTLSTGINSTVSYAKSAKSCPYFSLFFPNLAFHRENSGKWAKLSRCHAKSSLPSRPQTHNEICRRKEQIVLQKVLPKEALINSAPPS